MIKIISQVTEEKMALLKSGVRATGWPFGER